MRTISGLALAASVMICAPLLAQDAKPTDSPDREGVPALWTKTLTDRAKRGTLHDTFQNVRGDTGKWSDEPRFLHAPPLAQKPSKTALDDWFDQLLEQKIAATTAGDDNWLLVRTRQLDDNDRVWVEGIERRGNQFTVLVNEAIWQGRYFKTFTYYNAFGVNLGKLEPGKYEAKLIIKSLAFTQFDGDGRPIDHWPKDERPAEKKTVELRVAFTIVKNPR